MQPADRLAWTIARHAATMPEGTVFAATASAVGGIRLAQLLLGCRLYLNNRGGAFDLDGPIALHARHWMFNRRPRAHVDLAGVFDTLSEPHALFATPAQVDGEACANLSGVGPHATPKVAFGGTRGMPDAKTIHFVLPSHGVRQLVRKVDFVSTCAANRAVAPMLFTELCVMRFDRATGQWQLEGLAPGQTVETVTARTGFDFRADAPANLEEPPAEAIRLLDTEVDPLGLRHLDFGAGRGGLMDAMARVYEREVAIVGLDKVPAHRRSCPVRRTDRQERKGERTMDDLQRMLAERACERLVNVYANLIDDYDYDAFLALWADDCEWNMLGTVYKGLDGVRAGLTVRDTTMICRHFVTNSVITVLDADHAEGVCYTIAFRELNARGKAPVDMVQPNFIVHYRDRFVRDAARGWLFARRDIVADFANRWSRPA